MLRAKMKVMIESNTMILIASGLGCAGKGTFLYCKTYYLIAKNIVCSGRV